jgi:hypothetical protein
VNLIKLPVDEERNDRDVYARTGGRDGIKHARVVFSLPVATHCSTWGERGGRDERGRYETKRKREGKEEEEMSVGRR